MSESYVALQFKCQLDILNNIFIILYPYPLTQVQDEVGYKEVFQQIQRRLNLDRLNPKLMSGR